MSRKSLLLVDFAVLVIGMAFMVGCGETSAKTMIGTLSYCDCNRAYTLTLPDGQATTFTQNDVVELDEVLEPLTYFPKVKVEQMVRLPQKRATAVLLKEPTFKIARWRLWHFDTVAEYESHHEPSTAEVIDLDRDKLMQEVADLKSKIEVLETQVKKLDWLRSDIISLRADVQTATTISEQNIKARIKAEKELEETKTAQK